MSIDPQTGLPIPQKSSGGCFKSCLTMGCFGVILMGLCCGGVTWFFSQSIQFQKDPQIAALVGQEIADGSLFDDFKAVASVKVDLPVFGPVGKMAIYEGADHAALVIGEVNNNVAGAGGKEALEQKIREEMGNNTSHKDVTVISKKVRDIQINGKPVPFSFEHSKSNEADQKGKEVWSVSGSFEGKTGPVFVFLIVPHDKYTEDQLADKLETIKLDAIN